MFRLEAITGLVIIALILTVQRPSPSIDDWDWLNKVRDEAFQQLMPLEARPERLVHYRSYRDLYTDVPERYFTIAAIGGVDSDELMATLVKPVGQSIQQQLLQLHMKRPGAPLGALLPEVAVLRIPIGSAECRSLRARVEALSRVSVSIPRRDRIVLHPQIHRLVIDLPLATIDATFSDDENPVVRWAIDTARAIETCAARSPGGE